MKNELTKAQLLDGYLNTEDAGFNKLIQEIIETNTKPGEIFPDDYVIEYMALLDDIYSFYLVNSIRPIQCLDYFVAEATKKYTSNDDIIYLTDSILRLLSVNPKNTEDEFARAFILLLNYRHGLSPYDKDSDVINFCSEFNYEIVRDKIGAMLNPYDKVEFLKERLRLFDEERSSLSEYELSFIEETAFLVKCKNEIERQQNIIEKATTTKHEERFARPSGITQSELAFYYYYLHEKGCRPRFPEGDKKNAYIEVTQPHGLAWKPFQMKYNSLRRTGDRLTKGNIEAIRSVIPMLRQHPDAQQLAEDELLIAESRNPLT